MSKELSNTDYSNSLGEHSGAQLPEFLVNHLYMSSLISELKFLNIDERSYTLPFSEWILAGISSNYRGTTNPDLRVAKFVLLARLLRLPEVINFQDGRTSNNLRLEGGSNSKSVAASTFHNFTEEEFRFVVKMIKLYYRDLQDLMYSYCVACRRKEAETIFDVIPSLTTERKVSRISHIENTGLCIKTTFDCLKPFSNWFNIERVSISQLKAMTMSLPQVSKMMLKDYIHMTKVDSSSPLFLCMSLYQGMYSMLDKAKLKDKIGLMEVVND